MEYYGIYTRLLTVKSIFLMKENFECLNKIFKTLINSIQTLEILSNLRKNQHFYRCERLKIVFVGFS